MLLQDFINSQLGPWTGYLLGNVIPRSWAYGLADFLANTLAKRTRSNLYQSVRANQAVVRELPYDSPVLDGVVGEVLRNAGRGYVDWFRAIAHFDEIEEKYCTIDEHIIGDAVEASAKGSGVVFVGAHMSSFNLFMIMMAKRKLPIQVLSYHNVRGSYKADNEFRRRIGVDITPVSNQSLRRAISRLHEGGFVLTGVDRPDLGGVPMRFFGRKIELPIGHARLAIRTGSQIVIGVVLKRGVGRYHVTGPRIIVPERTGDDQEDILRLAQNSIYTLETYIRCRPEEWMMFLPVWPDALPAA